MLLFFNSVKPLYIILCALYPATTSFNSQFLVVSCFPPYMELSVVVLPNLLLLLLFLFLFPFLVCQLVTSLYIMGKQIYTGKIC